MRLGTLVLRSPAVLIKAISTLAVLVAKYADACNFFDIPDGGATVRHKLGVLARLCQDEGRPYDEIEKTISTRLGPGESGEAFADRCTALADLGIDHVTVITNRPWTPEAVRAAGHAVTR